MAIKQLQSDKENRLQFWVKLILGIIVILAGLEILVGLLQAFSIIPG